MKHAAFCTLLSAICFAPCDAAELTIGDAPVATLKKRTDANVASDIAAARAAGLLPTLESATESGDDEPATLQLSEDGKSTVEELNTEPAPILPGGPSAAESDDEATSKPSLIPESTIKESSPQSLTPSNSDEPSTDDGAIPAGYTMINGIAYSPECLPLAYRHSVVIAPAKVSAKPSVEQIDASRPWTDDQLRRRVEEISGGTLTIGGKLDAAPTTRTQSSASNRNAAASDSRGGQEYAPVTSISNATELQAEQELDRTSKSTLTIDGRDGLTMLKPVVRYASYQADSEATQQPTISPTDSGVVPAAFQEEFTMPNLSTGTPSTGSPLGGDIMPSSPPPIVSTPLPSNPVPTSPSTSVPLSSVPLNSGGTLSGGTTTYPLSPGTTTTPLQSAPSTSAPPTYDSPNYRTAPVVSGEPFVTEGPCQFDAAYMVEPAYYGAADPCANPCSPLAQSQLGTAVPTSPYAGAATIPGYYAPPTMAAANAPQLYTSNGFGFRPLIGFAHQENYNMSVGRGVFGQPVAYVQGQFFRNLLRYVFP